MKILGIDYGTKRIGLAVSDETFTLAREFEILSPKQFWEKLPEIITANEVKEIVVGWPLGANGNETAKTLEVKEFITALQAKTGLPVEKMDERFSSSMAENLPGGRSNTDSLAAQIILQNFLDKKKNV